MVRAAASLPPTRAGLVTSFATERPVFGGRTNRALGISFRVAKRSSVTVDVLRGSKLVKRYKTTTRQADRTHRLRFDAEKNPRGDYRIRTARGRCPAAGR